MFLPRINRFLDLCLTLLLCMGIGLSLFLYDPFALQSFREPKMLALLLLAGTGGLFLGLKGFVALFSRGERFSLPPFFLSLIPLALIFGYRTLLDLTSGKTESHTLRVQYYLYILLPVVAFFVLAACASTTFTHRRSRSGLGLFILLGLLFEGLLVLLELLEAATGIPLNPIAWTGAIDLSGQILKESLYGTIGNPNFVGGYFAIAVFPALGWLLSCKGWLGRLPGMGVVALTVLVLLVTRSKGAVLALTVGCLHFITIAVYLSGSLPPQLPPEGGDPEGGGTVVTRKIRSKWIGPFIVLLLFILICGWLLADRTATTGQGSYLQHWQETVLLRGDSLAVRALLAECGFELLKESLWIGIGPGEFKIRFLQSLKNLVDGPDAERYLGRVARLHSLRANHLHNEYLQILVEWGLIGLLSILLFLAWFQVIAMTRLREDQSQGGFWQRLGFLSGVWAALGGSLFDLPLHRPSQAYLLAILMGASVAGGWYRHQVQVPQTQGFFPEGRGGVWLKPFSWFLILILMVSGGWMFQQSVLRYVSIREVFMARAILDGTIGGGKTEKAAAIIRKAIRRVPGEGEYDFLLAHYQLQYDQDPNAAIVSIRKARFLSDHPDRYLLEGRAQIAKRNFQAALAPLTFYQALDSDRPGLNYLLGCAYQGLGHTDKARTAFLADLYYSEKFPHFTNPDLPESILKVAGIYENMNDPTQAAAYYECFLKKLGDQKPTYPLAQLSLGRIYRDQLHDYERSEKNYREAIEILNRQGNTEEAAHVQTQLDLLQKKR